jgi:elongation factor Ts
MDTLKELREETGLSFAQIKKALDEAQGDKEKARAILSEYSALQAEKKADREVAAGKVASYIHSNGTVGVLLELGCETDFVANTDEFKTLAYDLAMHVCAMAPTSVSNEDGAGDESALIKQSFIKNPEITVEQQIQAAIQKLGENIKVVKFTRYAI